MTDVEKIAKFLEMVEIHLSGIREEIAALSEDTSKKQTTASIKEYFGNTMDLIDLYLRSIEELLDEKLIPMVQLERITPRLDALEATVKEHAREIAELKKKLTKLAEQ